MPLFEVAILTEDSEGETVLALSPKAVVAADEKAAIVAVTNGANIPLGDAESLEVLVRPFCG